MDDLMYMLSGQPVVIILLIILAIIFIIKGIQKVPDGRSRVVERLGRRHKILKPGLGFIVPFLDQVKKDGLNIFTFRDGKMINLVERKGDIVMSETRLDPPPKEMIAKDNSEVNVDIIGFFRITEPAKTVYDVDNVYESLQSLMETTLRQEVGKLDSDTLIASRDILSEKLRNNVTEAAISWGIQVTRIEIESIEFAGPIQEKLAEARREELIRRAQVIEAQAKRDMEVLVAEGEKASRVLKAEGIRESQILEAEGKKQEEILIAQGEFEKAKLEAEGAFLRESREREGTAQGYDAINKALKEKPEAVIALETLDAQKNVAKSIGESQNALILPAETAGLFGAIGSITKGMSALSSSLSDNLNGEELKPKSKTKPKSK